MRRFWRRRPARPADEYQPDPYAARLAELAHAEARARYWLQRADELRRQLP